MASNNYVVEITREQALEKIKRHPEFPSGLWVPRPTSAEPPDLLDLEDDPTATIRCPFYHWEQEVGARFWDWGNGFVGGSVPDSFDPSITWWFVSGHSSKPGRAGVEAITAMPGQCSVRDAAQRGHAHEDAQPCARPTDKIMTFTWHTRLPGWHWVCEECLASGAFRRELPYPDEPVQVFKFAGSVQAEAVPVDNGLDAELDSVVRESGEVTSE